MIEEISSSHIFGFLFDSKEKGPVDVVSNQEVMEFMEEKVGELAKLHLQHQRKQVKDNARLRQRILETIKSNSNKQPGPGGNSSTQVESGSEEFAIEPVWFNDEDLTLLKANEGPSAFGRLLGAKMFGSEKKCELMKVWLGPKVMRKSGRVPCSAEIQNTFTGMIGF